MKISFQPSPKPRAQAAFEELVQKYGDHAPEDADVLVVLGGDGTMLRALHQFAGTNVPIYGLNLGTLGFLLNENRKSDLPARIEAAKGYTIHPLRMVAADREGKRFTELAFNEVSLLRETHSSAKIMVFVNEEIRLPLLVCDGVMLSTPVGSTAYNSSAAGPIVPLSANVLPMTPISAFRPRRWPGALLPNTSRVRFEVIKPHERPVSVSADFTEIRDVVTVDIEEARDVSHRLLFDPDNHLEERIFQEQFAS
ncbi:MAG: NAD kinase [Alphaproteobacteria bacterium]|nr:NAD kinase [Alphaproteobacteria bacterium]